MKTKAWAAAAVLAVAVSGCGDTGPETFTVKGVVLGTVGNPGQIKEGRYCEFTDGTVSVGDTLVIKASDGSLLGKASLTEQSMNFAVCLFAFEIPGVRAGEAAYSLKLDSFDAVVATESELRSEKLSLDIRGPMDVIMNPERKPIRLSTD